MRSYKALFVPFEPLGSLDALPAQAPIAEVLVDASDVFEAANALYGWCTSWDFRFLRGSNISKVTQVATAGKRNMVVGDAAVVIDQDTAAVTVLVKTQSHWRSAGHIRIEVDVSHEPLRFGDDVTTPLEKSRDVS